MIRATLTAVGEAALVSYRDEQTIFTLRTWLTGWMLRVVAQVVFFALIGRLVGDPDYTRFLVVGNLVMLVGMTVMAGGTVITWERRKGMLPFDVAAPVTHVAVLLPRVAFPIVQGVATAVLAAPLVLPMFGVELQARLVLPGLTILLLTAVTVAGLAAFVGSVLLWRTRLRNVGTNTVTFTMMVACGVNVPLGDTPLPLRVVGEALPLTRALLAFREVVDGAPLGAVAGLLGAETLVGMCWYLASVPFFLLLAARGRRDGTLFEV